MFKALILLWFYVPFSCGTVSEPTTSLISPRDSGGWGSSGTGVQSFFDIALTALAFLSFGIFLLNLLMNALLFTSGLTPGITSTGPIITSTGDYVNTNPSGTGGGTGQFFRGKRSIVEFEIDPKIGANILAQTVVKSVEAMVHRYECLSHVFCEGNRQAKLIGHGFQYLMPLYSFSSSYVGERLGLHEHLPDHIDAILHGVSEFNCQSQFPKC